MRTAFCSVGGIFGLLLLMVDPGQQSVESFQAEAVECICVNDEYLTCDWGSKRTPGANYSLFFWYEGSEDRRAECRNYTQVDGLNVGCWIREYKLFVNFYAYLNASRGRTFPMGHLIHRVRPGPPFNLTVLPVGKHQLNLTWKSPYKKARCLEHAVWYKSNVDVDWTEHRVKGLGFQLPSVDPEKLYTFSVRSKINHFCGTTNDLWSQPSTAVTWGKEGFLPAVSQLSPLWNWVLPLGSTFALMVLLLVLVNVERVRLVLLPRIPNPSRKFEDLFTAYQGNFSEWAGVSKEAVVGVKPSYPESICCVTELLPGGGDQPTLGAAPGEAGALPGFLADPKTEVERVGLPI